MRSSVWFTGSEFLKDPNLLSNHLKSECLKNDLFNEGAKENYVKGMRPTEKKNACVTS